MRSHGSGGLGALYDKVEDRRSIPIRRLHKAGGLTPGWHGAWLWLDDNGQVAFLEFAGGRDHVLVRHWSILEDSRLKSVDRLLGILWRPCPFGGERPFFLCPACKRPRLRLYDMLSFFMCRVCARLFHASRSENPQTRALRRAYKLRMRLGGAPDAVEPIPPRPKGMHWHTYERLTDEIMDREMMADEYGL
jgi:hypothetical protein